MGRGAHSTDVFATHRYQIETVSDAGHLAPMERPEAVAGLILDVLA